MNPSTKLPPPCKLEIPFYSNTILACLAEIAAARGTCIEVIAHDFICEGIDRVIVPKDRNERQSRAIEEVFQYNCMVLGDGTEGAPC